jgi:hypothetical protein
VRVPLPVVLILVVALVGGIWWGNTRHMDFMTPPTAEELTQVRETVANQLATLEHVDLTPPPELVVTPPPPPLPVVPPKPPVDLGDLSAPLALQNYGDRSQKGAASLIELAEALESRGEFQRAVLAWERVLDLAKPTADETSSALNAIKRLRPTLPEWNRQPTTAIEIQLQVSAGKNLTKALPAVLSLIAIEMQQASSGIVKIKTTLTKLSSTNKNAANLVISMKGTAKKPSTTEAITITATPETLRLELLKQCFAILSKRLVETTAYTPIPPLSEGENPHEALTYRVTRLCWSEFATGLNLSPKKKN